MFSIIDKRKTGILSQREDALQHIDIQKTQWFEKKSRIVNKSKVHSVKARKQNYLKLLLTKLPDLK